MKRQRKQLNAKIKILYMNVFAPMFVAKRPHILDFGSWEK